MKNLREGLGGDSNQVCRQWISNSQFRALQIQSSTDFSLCFLGKEQGAKSRMQSIGISVRLSSQPLLNTSPFAFCSKPSALSPLPQYDFKSGDLRQASQTSQPLLTPHIWSQQEKRLVYVETYISIQNATPIINQQSTIRKEVPSDGTERPRSTTQSNIRTARHR